MGINDDDTPIWENNISSTEELSDEEIAFIDIHSNNSGKAKSIALSLFGKSYKEIKNKFRGELEEPEEEMTQKVLTIDHLIGIDIALKRCIKNKEMHYDQLMVKELDSFLFLVEEGRDEE